MDDSYSWANRAPKDWPKLTVISHEIQWAKDLTALQPSIQAPVYVVQNVGEIKRMKNKLDVFARNGIVLHINS